jgi:hypothetical protein
VNRYKKMLSWLKLSPIALLILPLWMWMSENSSTSRPQPAAASAVNEPPRPSPGPAVFFTDAEVGAVKGGPNDLGTPISILGKGFGTERGASTVTIGGVEVKSYLIWGEHNAHNPALDMIVVQPGPIKQGGPIVVTVNGKASNAEHRFEANSGKIYYIASNGSDQSNCSSNAPCATVLHTFSVMKPGDVALVRGGTYNEGEIWLRAPDAGKANAPKLVKNYPGEEAYFGNAARDFLVDADYVTVSGLNFRNGKALTSVGWASHDQRANHYINNTFEGTINWAAIEIGGNEHVLAGNVCDVSGSTAGTMGHCYYVTQGTDIKVLYNMAKGAPGYGLHIYEEKRENNDFKRVIRNVLVEGNILQNSTQRSGMILAIDDQGGYGNNIENVTIRNNVFVANNHAGLLMQGAVRGVKVYNNTFYENGRLGLYVDDDSKIENLDIRNNAFYQSRNSNCSVDCGFFKQTSVNIGKSARAVTLSHNYYSRSNTISGTEDSTPVYGDIRFTNPEKLDFHILSGSVAINRGIRVTDVPTDYDGKQRLDVTNSDIGAFQN